MHGDEAGHYIEAMKNEVRQLMSIKTWTSIPRSEVPPTNEGKPRTVLKGI